MQLFRLAKKEYIRDLSGTGARRYGGRWNNEGIAAVYTSEHRSLAMLEYLVHASLHSLPPDLAMLILSVPDDSSSTVIWKKQLPANWRNYPSPIALANLGTGWILSGESILLYVPSVVIPDEWNIIINPKHPQFEKIEIEAIDSFNIDSRFLRSS